MYLKQKLKLLMKDMRDKCQFFLGSLSEVVNK